MESSSNECVFRTVLESCSIQKQLAPTCITEKQSQKIIACSKERKDNLYKDFEKDSVYHENCYATYTSKEKITKYLNKKRKSEIESNSSVHGSPENKRLRSTGTFNFAKACFICTKDCPVENPDPKNPSRWEKNRGILCQTADRGKSNDGRPRKSFKEVLLHCCDERSDFLGEEVRIRLQGAVSDLHAADARYHQMCYRDFVNERNIKAAQNKLDQTSSDKESFNFLLRSIRMDPDRIWKSTELCQIYQDRGGTDTHPTRLLRRLKEYLSDEIYFFKAQGISTVIMHKEKASQTLSLNSTDVEDELIDIEKVAGKIKTEIKSVPGIKDNYPVLSNDALSEICLPTLTTLLQSISPKFQSNYKATALISSIITVIASSKVSMLQVGLGLIVHEKKKIQQLSEYGITASFDEIRRFKISAASFSSKGATVLDSRNGLIQGVSDNFDANLSTQNGLKQTHSLASIVIQHTSSPTGEIRQPIPRLKKEELATVKLEDVKLSIHSGEKKPQMPDSFSKVGILPLKMLCEQAMLVEKSQKDDFQYIKDSLINSSTPDYGGYNARQARNRGLIMNTKSDITFKPLINKKPSDPSTVYTAMCEIE